MSTFSNFLKEERDYIIKKARKELSKKYNVHQNDLNYIGYTDAINYKLYQFNIMDKNHKQYKSTVGYKYSE